MSQLPPPADPGMGPRVGRAAKRVVITVVGATVAAAGLALLVLPGPGLVLVLAGLAILATEFRWARRLYERAKDRSKAAVTTMTRGPAAEDSPAEPRADGSRPPGP